MTKCNKCGKIIKIGVKVQIPTTPSGIQDREPVLQDALHCMDCFKKL